ncbi:uncharacterized protein B0P05DRAFT_589352 [Gilbertella persicaria]|uniref:uncharacterized protein n=1 Tax=Gilbertella persicaria TaxID=101096 RepID=UPI00222049C7|nr:uncharacterized protein B0P05DRAFT_589352 [Gilbertella persicaria]KAI8069034.1 hypothetical protein B0P05DRAFT_589352 [Gilbertella persicaria]
MSFPKPNLPSIQSLLNQDTHIKSVNVHKTSNLPSELQQLSLSAPATRIEKSENHQPSWMFMPPNRKLPSHTRSCSDFTFSLLPPPTTTTTTTTKPRYQAHRRTVSATTTSTTAMIQHNHSLPHISEYTRARTDSPPHHDDSNQALFDALQITSHSNPTVFLTQVDSLVDQETIKDKLGLKETIEYENLMVARDEQTGKYYCPFCNKPFNRPSSLRIHTYSHTGEKPFVCQEKGCGRQFSVQSNMRRHLRVHRRGKSKKHASR